MKSFFQVLALFAFALLCLQPKTAFAASSASQRHILDLGCQGTYCYVTFDGAPVDGLPGATCAAASNELRFDAATASGKLMYSSLLTAFVSSKLVDVYVDHCLDGVWNGVFMTITYFHLH